MYKCATKIADKSNRILEIARTRMNAFILEYPIYKGVLMLGSGTVIAQIITFLTMPIITRLYTPSDFGLLATYISILSLITFVASFSYNVALVLPINTEEAGGLFWLCILSLVTTSIGFFILVIFSGNFLLHYLHLDSLYQFRWFLMIGFFGSGLYQVFNYWAVRNRDYKRIASTKINQGISSSVCKIILGIYCFGPIGLIIGHIVSQIFGIGTFIRGILENDRCMLKNKEFNYIISLAKKHYSFPLYNLPASVINSLSFQLPIFTLFVIYDTQTVGFYSLAQSMLILPGSFIAGSISQAFMGDASKLLREGNGDLRRLYLSTIRHLSIIAIPFVGGLALIAPMIFPLVFGELWSKAGYFCIPLALVVIPQFIFSPTSQLYIYNFNNISLLWNVIRTGFVIIGFYISHLLMLPIMITLTIYGLVMLIMYLVDFWLNLKAISRLNTNISSQENQ